AIWICIPSQRPTRKSEAASSLPLHASYFFVIFVFFVFFVPFPSWRLTVTPMQPLTDCASCAA
ncbi:MAG: hypothetical protein WD534_17830, partial [Phycisphaeraceae bacterium]